MALHVQMSVLTGRGIREPIDIILRAILNDMQLQIQLAVALQNLKIIVEGDGGVSEMSYINRITGVATATDAIPAATFTGNGNNDSWTYMNSDSPANKDKFHFRKL
jgi:hypothetical protein